MSIEDKNFGPSAVAAIMGVCVSEYVQHGVTRAEFVELAGELYDGIAEIAPGELRCGCGRTQTIKPQRVPGDGITFVEAVDEHGWECKDEEWRCPGHAAKTARTPSKDN